VFGSRERQPQLTEGQETGEVKGVALLLPGGKVRSHRGPLKLAELGLRELQTELVERGRPHGIAVHLLRYRYAGWNGADADTAADTRWALDRLAERYGEVPVVLIGNSLGGRAAFREAGRANVAGVAGLAPWLPEGDPVDQLAGRRVLIIHGDRDRGEAGAAKSLAFAERALAVTPALARYEVPGAGHWLVKQADDLRALTTAFVLSVLGTGPDPLTPGGLRTPLPVRGAVA
jgi:pimeloyl-ACP methyl ester carboxylesterase